MHFRQRQIPGYMLARIIREVTRTTVEILRKRRCAKKYPSSVGNSRKETMGEDDWDF